jgi:hypothetical protein
MIETLITWLSQNIDMPAIALLIIFVLGIYVLNRTQKSNNAFDFADMLRDEGGKPSAFRLAIFVCLAISSWAIMYMLVKTNGSIDTWIYVAYISVWSGAKVAEKALDAYGGRQVPTQSPLPSHSPVATASPVATVMSPFGEEDSDDVIMEPPPVPKIRPKAKS